MTKKILEGEYPSSQTQMVSDEALFNVLKEVVDHGLYHQKNKASQKKFYNGYLGHFKAISKLLEDTEKENILEVILASKPNL